MSEVETATAVSRETIAEISAGDAVELAIDTYEWSKPLDVVDADDPVKWDVRFGTDWWMRTIYLEGGHGAEYGILYDNHGDDPRVVCHRIEDGELGDMRGSVVHLARVEDDDKYVLMRGSTSATGDTYHLPDPDNPSQPQCKRDAMSDTWFRKPLDSLDDDWSLCQNCDDSDDEAHAVGDEFLDDLDDEDDEPESEPEIALPDGLTTEDVENAVESSMEGGRAYLGEVAEALGISTGKARSITVRLGLYSGVSEGRRGGR